MRQHRTLQIRLHPVEQVHSLGLRVVVARDLFLQQADQKTLQIVIFWQQAKFLQHQLGAPKTLHIFVLGHVLFEIAHHLIAAGETALDLMLDGKRTIFRGKVEDRIHVAEEFFGLLGSDFGFSLVGRLLVGLPGSLLIGV